MNNDYQRFVTPSNRRKIIFYLESRSFDCHQNSIETDFCWSGNCTWWASLRDCIGCDPMNGIGARFSISCGNRRIRCLKLSAALVIDVIDFLWSIIIFVIDYAMIAMYCVLCILWHCSILYRLFFVAAESEVDYFRCIGLHDWSLKILYEWFDTLRDEDGLTDSRVYEALCRDYLLIMPRTIDDFRDMIFDKTMICGKICKVSLRGVFHLGLFI